MGKVVAFMPRHSPAAAVFQPDDIRALRRDAHLTQRQLADALGYSYELIRSWEQGRRTMSDTMSHRFLTVIMTSQLRRAHLVLSLRDILEA